MKGSTGILVGAAVLALAGGYSYYTGINRLAYGLYGINTDSSGRLGIQIAVHNQSYFFTYPVPGAFINVADSNGNYIGSLETDDMQWIRPNGISILQTWVIPTYQGLLQLLGTLIAKPEALQHLILNGVLKIGSQNVHLDTHLLTGLQLPQS